MRFYISRGYNRLQQILLIFISSHSRYLSTLILPIDRPQADRCRDHLHAREDGLESQLIDIQMIDTTV